jgi:hypothetical protein
MLFNHTGLLRQSENNHIYQLLAEMFLNGSDPGTLLSSVHFRIGA